MSGPSTASNRNGAPYHFPPPPACFEEWDRQEDARSVTINYN